MPKPWHHTIAFRFCRALPVFLVLISAGASPASSAAVASSDRVDVPSDAIAHALSPAQISTLIAAAAGRAEVSTNDLTAQLARLGHALDVDSDVAVALLRILDTRAAEPERLIEYLAQSATQYHAVTNDLAAMRFDDADAQFMAALAQATMTAARFHDAETQIQQLEDHEVASAQRSSGAVADRHRLAAARARTLLGKIALMNLDYEKATEDFELARQRIAMATGQSNGAGTAALPSPRLDSDWSQRIASSQPGGTQDASSVATGPIMTVMVRPSATVPVTSSEAPKSAPVPALAATASQPGVALRSLSADIRELLLRRGDAMLGLGDVAAARLLYERAAAAGEARGATGAGKTYDPKVLSLIRARGIQGDAAVAAAWYRKALDLGDASAATRLSLLGQASGQ